MTDRIQSFVVVLDRDLRTDDVEIVLNALRMIKYVASVEPVVVTADDYMARERIRVELEPKLYKAIEQVFRLHRIDQHTQGDR